MKKKNLILLSLVLIIMISACSSSEETTGSNQEESQPEVYVFDDVTEAEDTTQVATEAIPVEQVTDSNEIKYYVQVGAFTTNERAQQFQKENSSKISYPMNISYSDDVKLFVVQLPPFPNRAEAERVRNELWQISVFKDAFIVTK